MGDSGGMEKEKNVSEGPTKNDSEGTCTCHLIKDKIEVLTTKMEKLTHDVEELTHVVEELKQKQPDPQAQFPAGFKISDIDKFDGTGDPELHLRKFSMLGLQDDQKAYAFPVSLTGNAERWYRSSNVNNTKKWDELQKEFKKHFSYKIHLDVTLRDLETTRQKPNETFSEFIVRWKQTAAKMIDRPNEKEQVNIIIKNLAPVYYSRMFCSPIMNFEQLHECGIKIEDAINKGELDQNEGKLQAKKECSCWFSTRNNGPDVGHNTDNCMWLRNEIQNLIDQNVIPKPPPPNHIARCCCCCTCTSQINGCTSRT